MMKRWHQRSGRANQRQFAWRDESGNVLVLVAIAMSALLAMGALVVDLGDLYIQKQQLQAAADAGALAGADSLLSGSTVATAQAAALAATNDASAIYQVSVDAASNEVTVKGSRTLPLWFAKMFGDQTGTVHATSTAEIGTLTSAVGVVPIGVPNQTFVYGEEVALTEGAGDGQSGNYGLLDFSGGGASGVSYNIEHGYQQTLQVGQQVSTQPGLEVGPVSTAIQYRITEADNQTGCSSFSTAQSDCASVMYLPVIDSLDVHGKKDVTILGFASFFLEGLSQSGGHQQVVGRFIQMVRGGALGQSTNYGTYGVRLIS